MYQYDCAGYVSLCQAGFTLAFWAKVNASYWELTDNYTLYSALGVDEPESSQGVLIYFTGRRGVMEVRREELGTGRRDVTVFDMPIDVFFYFTAIGQLTGPATIYINGYSVSTTSYTEEMTIVRKSPPNTLASFGWSPQFPDSYTVMSVDELVFDAVRIVVDDTLQRRYRNYRLFNVYVDQITSFSTFVRPVTSTISIHMYSY